MTPKAVLSEWVDAFNRRDAKAVARLYAQDAVNFQVAEKSVEGRQAIEANLEYFFSAFPDNVCKPVNMFEDGEWAMLEWEGWGTHLGEFAGQTPSGKKFELRGCGFFHVKDGKIAYQRGYWDRATWFGQIGIPL
jgi:steroid delta-isomerase-like uncharacterized protein